MSDFGKLEARFWQRGTGKRLRGDKGAQILATYLMSCESARALGLFYLPWALLTSETGLTVPESTAALTRLEAEGFAFYDRDEELAWLPGMALRRVGDEVKEGDKRRPGLLKDFASLPDHRFRDALLEEHGGRFGLCAIQKRPAGKPLGRGFEGASKGLPESQEGASKGHTPLAGIEEEEIEKKRERESEMAHASPRTQCDLGVLPTTPPVRTSDDPAANAILARLRTHPSLAPIASLRTAEALSAVLLGGKKLDWVLQSVDDLALKASLAAARETPIPFNELSDMAGRYASNARPPKPGNAPTGAKLTPADVEAEQRRRKVQVGATDWSQEADVSVETEVG